MERPVEALFTHDAVGRIVRVREHDGAPAPRFFLGRTADGLVRRSRHDVDDVLCRALEAACDASPPPGASSDPGEAMATELSRCAAVLARSARVERTEAGPAFNFPDELPAPCGEHDSAVAVVTEANADILYPCSRIGRPTCTGSPRSWRSWLRTAPWPCAP